MSLKISVDGGGLAAEKGERFGNYIFAENIINALKKYDRKNKYFIYTMDKLKPRFAWSKIRLSIEEFKKKKNVFLALNQAFPIYTSGKKIAFCHGLSYYFYPKHYSLKDSLRLRNQLDEMIIKSDIIVVSSDRVKKDLDLIIPKYSVKRKIVVLPFGIPFDMESKLKPKNKNTGKYFLFVGMDHPVKNIGFIKKSFAKLKKTPEFKNYRLILITKNCPREKLRNLYRNAQALLTASHYESFNLPVLEALSQGCPVIGLKQAIIPELKNYVYQAENEKQFIHFMKSKLIPPDKKKISALSNQFSWRKYVNKLVKLY